MCIAITRLGIVPLKHYRQTAEHARWKTIGRAARGAEVSRSYSVFLELLDEVLHVVEVVVEFLVAGVLFRLGCDRANDRAGVAGVRVAVIVVVISVVVAVARDMNFGGDWADAATGQLGLSVDDLAGMHVADGQPDEATVGNGLRQGISPGAMVGQAEAVEAQDRVALFESQLGSKTAKVDAGNHLAVAGDVVAVEAEPGQRAVARMDQSSLRMGGTRGGGDGQGQEGGQDRGSGEGCGHRLSSLWQESG